MMSENGINQISKKALNNYWTNQLKKNNCPSFIELLKLLIKFNLM